MSLYSHDLVKINYEKPLNEEYILVTEGVSHKEMEELMKNWKTSNQSSIKKTFKNDALSEEEYQEIMGYYHTMRDSTDYKEYKKAFDAFCKFCHIVPDGTIISKCKIRSGNTKKNNSILVEYSENTRKIKLPDGIKLYHISKVEGIKELIPVFKGKSVTGYMYDKPRIYFTIHEKMPKFLADYKWYESMHKYECKLDIKEVYVDPMVPVGRLQGAVYVETDKPIPVEEMGIKKKD